MDMRLEQQPEPPAEVTAEVVEPAPDSDKPASDKAATKTIGIFDSGIGGFTVAKAIVDRRPDLNLVYFGDTLNMPYGGRNPKQLAMFARNSIQFLLEHGMDILAVGCNASNSVLGQGDLKSFGVPVYDLVTSTTEWLQGQSDRPEKIALVATQATINSRYWERKLNEAITDTKILPIAAPEFVPLIEDPDPVPARIKAAITKYLDNAVREGAKTVLHGCTHYPLIQGYMEELYPELSFIDPAVCLAEKLISNLREPVPGAPRGSLMLYSSLPGEVFYSAGERALGRPIREFTKMYIVNPHEE